MNDSQLIAIAREKADIKSLRIYVDHWVERMRLAQEDANEHAELEARRELKRFIESKP